MRFAPVAALLSFAALAACVEPEPYHCSIDADCTVDGVPAVCGDDGVCAPAGPPLVAAGRQCLPGVALPIADPCAAQVCATRPWCCEDRWDENCVHAAETACGLSCSELLAGGSYMFAGAGVVDGDTYTPGWSAPASGWVDTAVWGDYDSDGHADLAIGREQQQAGVPGVVIYPYNPTGAPLLGDPLSIGGEEIASINTLQWIDYGHDGKLDILAGGNGGLYLILQDDGGAFTATRLSPSPVDVLQWIDEDGVAPWRIAVGYRYVDHPDPDPDQPPHTMVHLIDGTPPVLDAGMFLGEFYAGDLQYCQVSGGPARDLLIGTYPVQILLGTATGFDAAAQLPAGGYLLECADMDGDGDDDLVVGGGNSDPVDLMINDAGITAAEPISAFVPSDGLDVGDMDGDGDLDVLTSTRNQVTSPLLFLRNDSSGGTPDFTQSAGPDWNGPTLTATSIDLGPGDP